MTILLPDANTVTEINSIIIQTFGGRRGKPRQQQLESSMARPMQHIAYSDCNLHKICAILLQAVAQNHPFVDGNKRTAVLTCIYTYGVNNVILDSSLELNQKLEELVLDVVIKKPSLNKIAERLQVITEAHTKGSLGRALEVIVDFFTL